MGCGDACIKGKLAPRRYLKLHFEFLKKDNIFFGNVSFPCGKSADGCTVGDSLSNLHKSLLLS